MSNCYYTGMRGVLVGGLCVTGAFLLACHGYDRWHSFFTNAAGIGAVGVALFPPLRCIPLSGTIVGGCHYASRA